MLMLAAINLVSIYKIGRIGWRKGRRNTRRRTRRGNEMRAAALPRAISLSFLNKMRARVRPLLPVVIFDFLCPLHQGGMSIVISAVMLVDNEIVDIVHVELYYGLFDVLLHINSESVAFVLETRNIG